MIFIEIDDVPITASILEYEVSLQDLDSENSKRTETGEFNRDRIRSDIYKIKVKWMAYQYELQQIANALKPAKVKVKFFDPNTNSFPVKDMYYSDRVAVLVHLEKDDVNNTLWELSTTFIEY